MALGHRLSDRSEDLAARSTPTPIGEYPHNRHLVLGQLDRPRRRRVLSGLATRLAKPEAMPSETSPLRAARRPPGPPRKANDAAVPNQSLPWSAVREPYCTIFNLTKRVLVLPLPLTVSLTRTLVAVASFAAKAVFGFKERIACLLASAWPWPRAQTNCWDLRGCQRRGRHLALHSERWRHRLPRSWKSVAGRFGLSAKGAAQKPSQ